MDSQQITNFLCTLSKEVIQPTVVILHTYDSSRKSIVASNAIVFNGLNWGGSLPTVEEISEKYNSDYLQMYSVDKISNEFKSFINHDDTLQNIKQKILYFFDLLSRKRRKIDKFVESEMFVWENINEREIYSIRINFPR